MKRRINPNQVSSSYNPGKHQTDSSYDCDYSVWLPGDERLSSDMQPYRMNCGQVETSEIDLLGTPRYDKQLVSPQCITTEGNIYMSDPRETMYSGGASPGDFDFDQSYRRLFQDTNSIHGEIKFKQDSNSYIKSQTNGEFKGTSSPSAVKQGRRQSPGARKYIDRDFDIEKELRRLRNNEASRRSRREKKRRFLEIEHRVEQMKASNRRLSEFLQELDSIIDETKAILLAVNPSASIQPLFQVREPNQ